MVGLPRFPSGRDSCRREAAPRRADNNATNRLKTSAKPFYYLSQSLSLHCRGAIALSTATWQTRFLSACPTGAILVSTESRLTSQNALSRDDCPVDRDTATTLFFSLLHHPTTMRADG
ncbi:hypothetical protein [Spirosoma daeguense]